MLQTLVSMLELQDKMNTKVHAQWRDQEFAWFRALWVECGELLDHYGYKWWKKQLPDMQQVQLEVVDIWHFGLSMLLKNDDYQTIALSLIKQLDQADTNKPAVIEATETLAADVLVHKRFDVVLFAHLLMAADMSWDDLYRAYVGKNVLNFFRQDHGYKEGSYIKLWQGREDNEYLAGIMDDLDTAASDYAEQVYQGLKESYKKVFSDQKKD